MFLSMSLLIHVLHFIRDGLPLTPLELHLEIPDWARNPSRLQRLIVFNATPLGIFVSTAPNMNALAVTNAPLVIHNTAVSTTTAPSAVSLPIWPGIVQPDIALSVMPPTIFSLIVLLWRTLAQRLSSMRETLRDFDVVPVVQIFERGIVMVQGHGLIFSIVHLPLLSIDSSLTFTILVIFFADTFCYIVW